MQVFTHHSQTNRFAFWLRFSRNNWNNKQLTSMESSQQGEIHCQRDSLDVKQPTTDCPLDGEYEMMELRRDVNGAVRGL